MAKDSTTALEKIEDINTIQQINVELNFIIKDFLGCLSIYTTSLRVYKPKQKKIYFQFKKSVKLYELWMIMLIVSIHGSYLLPGPNLLFKHYNYFLYR